MTIKNSAGYSLALAVLGFFLSTAACAQTTQSRRPQVQSATSGASCNAARMPGADVGAKVNACDKQLGTSTGEILLTGGGTISTQIVISPNHTLRVVSGVYRATSDGPVIRLKDNSSLVCDSWDAVLEESTKPHVQGTLTFTIVGVYNGTSADAPNGTPSQNVNVKGCHFRGARSDFDSVTQTVSMSNCSNCRVTNNWLEGTRTIGIQAGGGGMLGHTARNVIIANNQLTTVASQNLAVVNSIDVQVIDNIIKAPGQAGGPGVVPIDLEPNVGDKIQNIKIANNTVDMTNTVIDQFGAKGLHGIAINNSSGAVPFTGVEVTNNKIYGAALSDPNNRVSGGLILVRQAQNAVISNNTLRRGTFCILVDTWSARNTFSGNQLSTCGSGSTESVRIENSSENQFLNNKLWGDPANLYDWSAISKNIVETGASNNNVFRGNDAVIHLSGRGSRKDR